MVERVRRALFPPNDRETEVQKALCSLRETLCIATEEAEKSMELTAGIQQHIDNARSVREKEGVAS